MVYYISKEKALHIFSLRNPIRVFCIAAIVANKFFEYFVLLTILVNCVFMAMNDPPEQAE